MMLLTEDEFRDVLLLDGELEFVRRFLFGDETDEDDEDEEEDRAA